MVFLWFSYGFSYGFPIKTSIFLWFSYGFPMVFPLKPPFSYGFPMVFQVDLGELRQPSGDPKNSIHRLPRCGQSVELRRLCSKGEVAGRRWMKSWYFRGSPVEDVMGTMGISGS